MSDLLSGGPFTAFDMIVALMVLISALMAFARGFIRELASVAAFVIALIAVYFSLIHLSPIIRGYLPENWSSWVADILVVSVSFLIVYILAAWLGARFSRLIQTSADIGLIDRLFGLVFGAFRAFVVIVLVLLATRQFIEEAQLAWITEGYTYPYFVDAVIWVQNNFMVFAENVKEVIPEPGPEGAVESP